MHAHVRARVLARRPDFHGFDSNTFTVAPKEFAHDVVVQCTQFVPGAVPYNGNRLRGRVHSVRAKGSSVFLVLRQGAFDVTVKRFCNDNLSTDYGVHALRSFASPAWHVAGMQPDCVR